MDDLELQCPHCQSLLTIDEVGDLELVELPELAQGQHRGLGGLVTEHVNFDQRALYLANQQGQTSEPEKIAFQLPKLARAKPDTAPAPVQEIDPDAEQALINANKKDLNKRNLK